MGIGGDLERYCHNTTAFVKKINLKYSESTNPTILLDLDDIKKVTDDGIDIIKTIETRIIDINMDISSSIGEWIKPHENEQAFS